MHKLRMLHAQVEAGRPLPNQATVDAHFWSETDSVEVRADLADTYIYICAPEVLLLFSDNFDYQVRTCQHMPAHAWMPSHSVPFEQQRYQIIR